MIYNIHKLSPSCDASLYLGRIVITSEYKAIATNATNLH